MLLLLLLALAVRLWVDNCTVRAREYGISSEKVPAGFEGFRIAQISDLHGNERLYSQLLSAAKEAEPDIIVLTGDIADSEEQWPALRELLKELSFAPLYYVSGNHEWADLHAEDFFRNLSEAGVILLRNEWLTLEKSGDCLTLAGIEDPNGYADMPAPAEVITHIRQEFGGYLVTLCHRPELFPTLASAGADLVLSGHHHGGLIRLPLLGGLVSPAGFFPEYDAGLFTLGGSVLLVSPGLSGAENIPRLFNRPEVCVAVLHSA